MVPCDCCSGMMEVVDTAGLGIALVVEVTPSRIDSEIKSDSNGDGLGAIEELNAWPVVADELLSPCSVVEVTCCSGIELGPREVAGISNVVVVVMMGVVVFWKNICCRLAIGCLGRLTPYPLDSDGSSA